MLVAITEDEHFASINKLPNVSSLGAYILNNLAIFIKYSTTSSSSNWQFTFTPDHQECIHKLYDFFKDRTYIAFVCERDDICIADFGMLKVALILIIRNKNG